MFKKILSQNVTIYKISCQVFLFLLSSGSSPNFSETIGCIPSCEMTCPHSACDPFCGGTGKKGYAHSLQVFSNTQESGVFCFVLCFVLLFLLWTYFG